MGGKIGLPDPACLLPGRVGIPPAARASGAREGRAADSEWERQKLARACEEFEAIFIEQMLKAMRRTVESSESRQESIYRSLFDEEVSKVLARRGLGLKELLLGNLEQRALARGQGLEAQVSMVPADKESGEREWSESLKPSGNQE